MTMIKEKIINAVTVMNDNDAEVVWNLIVKKFPSSWDKIKEEAPDETDLQMLKEIEADPGTNKEYISTLRMKPI